MSRKSKKRRNRLITGGVVGALVIGGGIWLFAGGGDDGNGTNDTATGVDTDNGDTTDGGDGVPEGYLEVPFFADRVSAGELPPIEERLPVEPFFAGPGVYFEEGDLDWEDGEYGGTIEFSALGASGFMNIAVSTVLLSPSQTTEASLPNVLSEFEYNDDYTVFTMTIREGLKWSDGEPVTTEDVRFTFEDIHGNPDANRPAPGWLYTQGNPAYGIAEFESQDDRTFTLTFSRPYGQLVADLHSWIPGYSELFKPAHYLKQFHVDYADADELEALIDQHSRNDWPTLLEYLDVPHWDFGEPRALGMPTLNPWVLAESGENLANFERNPYYWHVDSNGRQLPYIDRVVVNRVVDSDALTNAILAGQVSVASGGDVSLSEMSVYSQNAERSGFRVFTTGSFNYGLHLYLNQDFEWTEEGSQWQALMTDPERRFHQAVASAIDGDAINTAAYFGLYGDVDPAWRVFDQDAANALLDDLGMERGAGGYRTYPDGSPFIMPLSYEQGQSDLNPVSELVRQQLADVGINLQIEALEPTLWGQRKDSNQIMASIHWNDGPGWASGISEDYLPNHKGPWATEQWAYFIQDGATGRELTPELEEFFRLHTERKEVPPGSPEGAARWEALESWLQENHAMIPITGERTTPTIVDVNMRNVPNEDAPVELDVYINSQILWYSE